MAEPGPRPSAPPSLLLWALVLGLTGVVAGIFGPASLMDESMPQTQDSQWLGLMITGPLAMAFGALMGLTLRRMRLSSTLQWQVLIGCTAALALGTAILCGGALD